MNKEFWKNKRVLVTGGAGFIGSNLVECLVSLSSKVKVVDNLERGRKEYLKPVLSSIDFCKLDLTKSSACKEACKDVDIIFHLASKVGGIGFYLNNPGEVILKNCLIDSLMLETALSLGIKRYLYASSAHVYPIQLQLHPDAPAISEEQVLPANPELSYGWAKLLAEKQIEFVISQGKNFRAAVVRLIGVYGKNQDIDLKNGSVIPVFCRRAIEYPKNSPFVIWGTGCETRSYCYIDDVIEGMLIAIEKLDQEKLIGPINLGSESRISINQIADLIIAISGKKIKVIKEKSQSTKIWGQAADCGKARQVLDGWQPKIPLEEGLKRIYLSIERRLAQ